MQDKPQSPSHGLPVSRAKTGNAPGASPTPTATTQIRQDKRAYYNPPARETEIGDRESGSGVKPGGKATGPRYGRRDKRGCKSGLPSSGGKVTGGGIASKILRMVPMPRYTWRARAVICGNSQLNWTAKPMRDGAAIPDPSPDPSALLASAGDLLDHLAKLTGDPRFRHAEGVLRGRRAGRPAIDDGPALEYAAKLIDAGLVRSVNAACLRAALMYSPTRAEFDAMRHRLAKKLRHK